MPESWIPCKIFYKDLKVLKLFNSSVEKTMAINLWLWSLRESHNDIGKITTMIKETNICQLHANYAEYLNYSVYAKYVNYAIQYSCLQITTLIMLNF